MGSRPGGHSARLGRYERLRPLGEGGQGQVWEAIQHGPGAFSRRVALKTVADGEGLRREARLGGLLRHANLVDVYEVGEVDGTWFLAMELCRDGSLAGAGALPLRAVVEIGLQVCAALDYAWRELGLVHADLKPANLLLDGPVVKVADLGLARAREHQRRLRLEGTPGYMAPELGFGAPPSVATDVYALGVVLHELATGRRPEPADTLPLDELPDEPGGGGIGDRRHVLDSGRLAVIAQCLAADPADRPPSMAAVSQALSRAAEGGPGLRQWLRRPASRPPDAPPARALLGRSAELRALQERLALPGVLTLLGPPGVGKSALARAAYGEWRGPRAFASLGEVRDRRGLVGAVARALEVPLGERGDEDGLAEQLGVRLAERGEPLLVLDDADHVDGSLLAAWATRAASARILVTSRRPLDGSGSATLLVDVPGAADAVALVRARAAERGVDLGADPRVADLVERLDRLPLALELAAGRLGVLSLDDVLRELSPGLLRSVRAGARGGTVDDALAWSTADLSPGERRVFAALAVFRGGFTLEAVDGVLAPASGAGPASDAVGVLLERSLVQADGVRLRLLEPVRAVAERGLPATERAELELAHGRWFARMGALDVVPAVGLRRERAAALVSELGNFVAACERALARGDGAVAGPTALAAAATLGLRGPLAEVARLGEAALGCPGIDARIARRLEVVVAGTLGTLGRDGHLPRLEAVIEASSAAGDRDNEAFALLHLGIHRFQVGSWHEAERCASRALALVDREPILRALALTNLGLVRDHLGKPAEAVAALQAAVDEMRAADRPGAVAIALGNLARIAQQQGRGADMRSLLEQSRAAAAEAGDLRTEGNALANLAICGLHDARLDEALRDATEAAAIFRPVGEPRTLARTLAVLATVHRGRDEPEAARTAFEEALCILRPVEGLATALEVWIAYAELELAQRRVPEGSRAIAQGSARAREVGDHRSEAYLDSLASLAADLHGDAAEADLRFAAAIAVLGGAGNHNRLPWALRNRAEGLAHRGDRAAAEAVLDEIVRTWPDEVLLQREVARLRSR